MLTRALRPLALSLLLIPSAAAISQMIGIQGNPYTATTKTTHVQKLADGTTITRVTTWTDARDSQGRTYHEDAVGMPQGQKHVIVTDPVANTMTTWLSLGKQATRFHMWEPGRSVRPTGATGPGSGSGVTGAGVGSGSGGVAMITGSLNGGVARTGSNDPNLRPERHTEKLGGKTIAGVYAEGTKETYTFPVGYMGNDRPITSVRETWTSPDLKITVLSTNDDPRIGLDTSELTNLGRAEPDPSLFQIPEGYIIKDEYPQSN